jgi:hypothetical protein
MVTILQLNSYNIINWVSIQINLVPNLIKRIKSKFLIIDYKLILIL